MEWEIKKKCFFPFLHVPLLFNAVILLPRKPPLVCSPWCAPTGYTLKDGSLLIDRRLRMACSSACSSHLNVTSLIWVRFVYSICIGPEFSPFTSTDSCKMLHWIEKKILIFIGLWLIYTVVLVLGVQQSESVMHINISTLFLKIYFPCRPLQSTE